MGMMIHPHLRRVSRSLVTHDGAEARQYCALVDLAEREAFGEVGQDLKVHCVKGRRCLEEVMESLRDKEEKVPRSGG